MLFMLNICLRLTLSVRHSSTLVIYSMFIAFWMNITVIYVIFGEECLQRNTTDEYENLRIVIKEIENLNGTVDENELRMEVDTENK